MAEEQPISTLESDTQDNTSAYLVDDCLIRHLRRQGQIIADALKDHLQVPTSATDFSRAYERALFAPPEAPKQQENGTCEPNPKINFYPTFATPETLATYHIFFQNLKIPASCKANRASANQLLQLKEGSTIPDYTTTDVESKIFEGLGDETPAEALQERDSILVELKNDSARIAVLKRTISVTHFAYPAIHLPPKILSCVVNELIQKKVKGNAMENPPDTEENTAAVTDAELKKWLNTSSQAEITDRRKTMTAVTLATVLLECMQRFFCNKDMIKKLGETLHYTFNHGYIKLASKISNVHLSNLITYMGVTHENRLGQAVLHSGLEGQQKEDYVRDTVFLILVYTWQTAMGVWRQCLDEKNLKQLEILLQRNKKNLWSGACERTIAKDLADIIFPPKLLETFHAGLPDLISQSQMQNFRSFILERSGILPAMSNALPTDFIPICFKECPPTMWAYTYLLQLANYFVYHNDLLNTDNEPGLLECYCKCNLCSPHRCLATNPALVNETQIIGSFDLRGPGGPDGNASTKSLRLTPALWTSAFLRKFEPVDFHPYKISFYENQATPKSAELTACVITQPAILAQLKAIKTAREEFLLKKGHGLYLDPHTSEPLNGAEATVLNCQALKNGGKSDRPRKQRSLSSGHTGEREQRRNSGGRRATSDPSASSTSAATQI